MESKVNFSFIMSDQSNSNSNTFTIDQIDFDTCQPPLTPIQVNSIVTTFFTDPELYSEKLYKFYEKEGLNIMRFKEWEQVYTAMLNIQNQFPKNNMEKMFHFISATLLLFSEIKNYAPNILRIRTQFLNQLISQYIENTNEHKWESIYITFYKLFRPLPLYERTRIILSIFDRINRFLLSNFDEIHFLGSLSIAYKFITDYEALIDLTSIGPQRHKTQNNYIRFNREKMKSLFTIRVQAGDDAFTFYVNDSTLISDISLALGVFYHTEYTNVCLYYQSILINPNYTISYYKLTEEDTILAKIQNRDTYNYDNSSFLSLLINADKNLFYNILSFIRDDKILSQCSSKEMANLIKKYAWKLLKVIPSYQPFIDEFQNAKHAINLFNQEKTELGRRYLLQIMCKVYNNNNDKMELGKFALDQVKQKKLSDNELRDAFEILKTYFKNSNKSGYDEDFIFTLSDIIVKSKNEKLCNSALDLFIVFKENAEIEKYIINKKGILLEIMRNVHCDVKPFFKSFRLRKDLFNILKELINEFSNDEEKLKRLFDVLKGLIISYCDTTDTFKYVLKNMQKVKSDLLIEFLEFSLHALEVEPSLLSKTATTEESLSIIDYLFEFISNVISNDDINKLNDYKENEEKLQAVSLRIFIVLCKNDDSVKKKILSKMEVMSNIQCHRWNYKPTAFKKSHNGYCGLRNLGSTCYMNSILQQLFYNDDCRTAALEHQQNDNKFVSEIRRIFIQLALSNQTSVDTEPFCNIWKEDDPYFSPRHQEDAEEFFHRLLSKLPKDVIATFEGKQTSKLKGISVDFSKEVNENFYLIPIPVKGYKSFADSVPTVYNPQMFTENNQYRDDQLGNIDVELTLQIDSLPKTIVFLLKRFDYNLQTKRRVKITNEFYFPLSFNADEYFSGQKGYYYLRGVITHSGTAEGGHYNALIRQGKEWVDFDDTESRKITPTEFNELVKGREKLENARCAYLLFFEMKENEEEINREKETNKTIDIKSYLQESELEAITNANNSFSVMQAAFDSSTANFALNSNDLLFTFNYFINVLCHSCMTNLAEAFSIKILKYLGEQPNNTQHVTTYLNESPITIFEITKSAASEFKDSICKILADLFKKVPHNRTISIVNYVVKNIKESISVWKTLPYFARIIHSYLSVGKDHVRIGNDNKWGNEIMDCIQTFYNQSLSSYALNNIDFSNFFRSLEILYPSMNSNETKAFVSAYESQIEESQKNLDAFRSLKDMIYGVKQAQNATSSPDIFCSYLLTLKDYEIINQSIEKCGKPKTWVLDALIRYSQTIAPLLFKYEAEVLLPLLTDTEQCNREKAEELIYKLFKELPKLENYSKADLLLLGHSHISVFDRYQAEESNKRLIRAEVKKLTKMNSSKKLYQKIKMKFKRNDSYFSYINKTAERFLDISLDYIGHSHSQLPNRMSNLFRVVHWLKVRLGSQNITNLKEVLEFVGRQQMSPNLDLIELLHLYQTFTYKQFDTFFKENNQSFMNSLSPQFKVNDRIARFIMFITLLTTPEQYMICLDSVFFFVAFSYLLECPLPQPFCYMAFKLCSILCNSQKKRKKEKHEKEEEENKLDDLDDSTNEPQSSNPVENTDDEHTKDEEIELPKPIIHGRHGDDEEEDEDEDNIEDDEMNEFYNLLSIDDHKDQEEEEEKEEELSKEDLDLLLKFADFLLIHADYSFFTPLTRDKQPCFIPILNEIQRYFTPELSSKCVTQYFKCFTPALLDHVNLKDFTKLIQMLPNTDRYIVSQEEAAAISKISFKGLFMKKKELHQLLINMVSSSLEFSNAFASEFELFVNQTAEYADFYIQKGQEVDKKGREGTVPKNPIDDTQVWPLCEVYILTANNLALNGEIKSQRVTFLVEHFFESSTNLMSCTKFAKSFYGKKCIKIISSILRQDESEEDQDDIFNSTIELFGFLTGNTIKIGPEIEEFLITYLEHLEVYDLEIESLVNSINNSSPDFEYAVTLLNVFFKAKSEMKEYFFQNFSINQDVLDNWPVELAQYRNLFIL